MREQGRPDPGRYVISAGCLVMAGLIAGAQFGLIPADEGAFFAPPPVITALWIGLALGGLLFLMPMWLPATLRSLLLLAVLFLVAIVCNWTAFAPDVTYSTPTSFSALYGAIATTREDSIGGRIVFGLVAIAVDLVLVGSLVAVVRQTVRRPKD
jgi:hypothetical protein